MNSTRTTRRAALIGALVSTAAIAAPLVARAAASVPPSPVPAMASAYAAARASLDAANAAYEAPFKALCDENNSNPVMVDLPGFRFNMAKVRATHSSPHLIEERYAQHYYLFSGKSGARVMPDGSMEVTGWAEIAVDQARDMAAALENWEAATVILKQRATSCGLTAAEERVNDACEALEAAWVKLLTYVPRTPAEVREKATAVMAIARAEPVQLDEEHAELFLLSLVGEAV